MIRYIQRSLLPLMNNMKEPKCGKYFFSKKMKRKLQEEVTKQIVQSGEPVKEEVEQQKSFAEKKQLRLAQQFLPSTFFVMFSLLQSNNIIFEDLFLYSVFGLEKWTTLVVLANLTYSQNKYMKYAMVGATLGLQFLPTMHLGTLASPLIQILLLITINRRIVKSLRNKQQKQKVIYEIRFKLLASFFLSSIIIFKAMYYQQTYNINNFIDQINMENKKIITTNQIVQTNIKQTNNNQSKPIQWTKSEFVS